ncbi:MAG: hypothetical protein K9J85_08415 [Desulfobacteraceae bacterium]|nr:hypothetical protein [Desulfobacteraceae bacterium]
MKNLFDTGLKTIFSAGLILVVVFSAAPVCGRAPANETRTVVAFGSNDPIADTAEAKRAAVSNGLLSAVQTAASELLSEEELRQDFETLWEILDKQRDEFIREYRILAEFKGEKKHYVLIRATVSNRELLESLQQKGIGVLPQQMPSLLLMIAEKNIDDLGFEYWWRSGLGRFAEPASVAPIKQALKEKGFPVIDPSSEGADTLEELKPGAEPSDYEASTIADRLGAQLVIVGTAAAEATANRMGEEVRTFRATVNLRVINAETGEKLTTLREQAMTMGQDPEELGKNAIADAAFRAGRQLSDRIASLWRKDSESTEKFTIHVKGDPVLAHLEKLRNALKQQSGLSELRTTEMTARSVVLSLQYRGTAQELADNLLMHSFKGFGVNITDISPKGLTMELIPK